MTKSLHSPETLGGLRKFCDAIVEFAERMRADLDKLHDEPDATVLTVGIARRRADLIGLLVPIKNAISAAVTEYQEGIDRKAKTDSVHSPDLNIPPQPDDAAKPQKKPASARAKKPSPPVSEGVRFPK